MATTKITSQQFFRTLIIIHSVMALGLVAVIGIFYFVLPEVETPEALAELSNVLYLVIPIFAIAGIALSYFVKHIRLRSARQRENLTRKLPEYQTTMIIQSGILETLGMLTAMSYFLLSEPLFLALTAAIAIIMLRNMPTKNKAIQDLSLNQEEVDTINDPEAVVSIMETQS